MRALLLLLPIVPLLFSSCGIGKTAASQRQILRQSKAEIAMREPWADDAAIFIEEDDDFWLHTWKVRAGAFDFSDYPKYTGIHLVPGTQRELIFTNDGCLIRYIDRSSRCASAATYESTGSLMVSEKNKKSKKN